ncbi:MAG: tetratricopeptide repeat protein [Myxococcota bacterium]|nr:tetratricopeptide repeat protein [Myxococcota bacterium]
MATGAVQSQAPRGSLFGPAIDGMLGFGGIYLLAFVGFCAFGPSLRASQPLWLFPVLALLLSAPHYGATLLRVYDRAEDREQHRRVAFHVTAALLGLFVVGVYEPWVASLLTTVYLTWSPWHFSAQNFGLALMVMGRRGRAPDAVSRRLFRIAFVASFALVAVVLHGDQGPQDYGQGGQVENIGFLSLRVPPMLAAVAVPLLLVVQGVCIALFFWRLIRQGGPRRILPVVGLVVIQALWFTVPFSLGHFQVKTGMDPLDYEMRFQYFAWISLAHAIQYLWVTTYYARSGPGWPGPGRYWMKALLAGQAIAVVPLVLFGPDALGDVSWRSGLFILIVSTLNIHHFILDGAIWKLRSQRVAKVLVHDGRNEGPIDVARSPWPRRLVWGIALAGTLMGVANIGNRWMRVEPQLLAGDLEAAERTLGQLAWFGADDESLRLELGRRALLDGQTERAERNFERAVELTESPQALIGLAEAQLRRRAPARSLATLERAIELLPDHAGALHRAGLLSRRLGDLDKAERYLARSAEIDPSNPRVREALEAVRRRQSQATSG